MAWSVPKTWVTGEFVTASDLNRYVRDNFNYLYAKPAFRCQLSTGQTVNGGGAWNNIAFGTTSYDYGSNKYSTTEIRVSEAGLWSFTFGVDVPAGGLVQPVQIGIYSATKGAFMGLDMMWGGNSRIAGSIQMEWSCVVGEQVNFAVAYLAGAGGSIVVDSDSISATFCAGHLVSKLY